MSQERDALLKLLAEHRPADAKEREDWERMLVFARTLEAPLSRAQPEAHFTGSAVVVDPTGERVCLVHHAKLRRWLQPGGHAEPGDGGDLRATGLREAREETGLPVRWHPAAPGALDVDVHAIPARKDEPGHLHLDVRCLVVADDPERLRADETETFGARWLSWNEALAVADEPALSRLLQKARACCRR